MATSKCPENPNTDDEKDASNPALQMQGVLDAFLQSFLASNTSVGGSDGDRINNNVKFCQLLIEVTESFDMHQRAAGLAPLQALAGFYCILQTIEAATECFPPCHELLSSVCCRLYECCVCLILDQDWLKLPAFTVEVVASKFRSLHESLKPWAQNMYLNVALLAKDPLGREPICKILAAESILNRIQVDKCLTRQGHLLLERRVQILLESGQHSEALSLARACSSHPQLYRNSILCEVMCLLYHGGDDFEGLASQVYQHPSVPHLIAVAESLASYCPSTAVLLSRFLLARLWEGKCVDSSCVERVTDLWVELTWTVFDYDSLQFAEALDSVYGLTDDPLFLYYLARTSFDKVGVGVIPVLISLCLGALRASEVHPSEDIITATSVDLGNVAHFQLLSELLENDVRMKRLCLLAVFYIAPSPENFASLKENYCSPTHSTGPTRMNSWQQQWLIQSVSYFVPGTIALSEDWTKVELVYRRHAQKSRVIISEWRLARGSERAVKLFLKPVACDEQQGRLLSVQEGKMRWKQMAKGWRKGPVLKAVKHMVPKLPRPEASAHPFQSSSTEKPACLHEQDEVDDVEESKQPRLEEVSTSPSFCPAREGLLQQPACVDSDLRAEMGKPERERVDQHAAEMEDNDFSEMDITEELKRPGDALLQATCDGDQGMEVSSSEQVETCLMDVVAVHKAHSDQTLSDKQADGVKQTTQKDGLLNSTSDMHTVCDVQKNPPNEFPGATVVVAGAVSEENGKGQVALVVVKGDDCMPTKRGLEFTTQNAPQAVPVKKNGTTLRVMKSNCVLTKIEECQRHGFTEDDRLVKSMEDRKMNQRKEGRLLSLEAKTLEDGPDGHVSDNFNERFHQTSSLSVMLKCEKTTDPSNCRLQVPPGGQDRVEVAASVGDTDNAKKEFHPTPYLSHLARSTEAASCYNSTSLHIVQKENARQRCQVASAHQSCDRGVRESGVCRGRITMQPRVTAQSPTFPSKENKQTRSSAAKDNVSGNCQMEAKHCSARSGGCAQSCRKNCDLGQGNYKNITIVVCPSNLSTSSDRTRRQPQRSTHNSVPEKGREQKTSGAALIAPQDCVWASINNPSQEQNKGRDVGVIEVSEEVKSLDLAESQKLQTEMDSVASKKDLECKEEGYLHAGDEAVRCNRDVPTEGDIRGVSSITDSDSCVWLHVKDSQSECEEGKEHTVLESDVPEAWRLCLKAGDMEEAKAVKSVPKGRAHCSPSNSCSLDSRKRKSVRSKSENKGSNVVSCDCRKQSNTQSRASRGKVVKSEDDFVNITMEDHTLQRGLTRKVSSRTGTSKRRANGVIKLDPAGTGSRAVPKTSHLKRVEERGEPKWEAVCTSPVAGHEKRTASEQDLSGRHRELPQNRLFAVTYNAKEALKKKLSPKTPSRNRKGPGPRSVGPAVLTRCMHAKARIPPPD